MYRRSSHVQSGYSNQATHQPRIRNRKFGLAFILFVGLNRYAATLLVTSTMKPTFEDVVRILALYAKLREMLCQIEINLAWLEASHYKKPALADMPGLTVNR